MQVAKLDTIILNMFRMLYDFYKYQNALRTDSVHATYLIYGVKDATPLSSDADVEMGSSQPEPVTESVPTMTMTLVSDENLNGMSRCSLDQSQCQ